MQTYKNRSWQPFHEVHEKLPVKLYDWLLYSGSFMERLRVHGVKNPYVDVVRQYWEMPEPHEIKKLDLSSSADVLIREVYILSENKRWMFARTVLPRDTLTGEQQVLANLGDRSLGSVLFNDPSMQRSEFEFSQGDEWGRRSIFTLQNKSLLLTEFFLKDMETL